MLLRALADIFVSTAANRPEDKRLFEELFLSLYPDSSEPDRAVVARQLRGRTDLSAAAAAAIALDVDPIAAVFVAESPAIAAVDLVRIAWRGGPEARKALAGRADLDRSVIEGLLVQPDAGVVAALQNNPTTPLAPEDLDRIRRGAPSRKEAAKRPANPVRTPPRRPLPAATFLDMDEEARLEAIAAISAETVLRQLDTRGRTEPAGAADGLADRLFALAATADRPGIVAVLADALALDPEVAGRILEDATGEPLAVALSALGIDNTVATSIMLLTRPAETATVWRLRTLARIHETIGWRAARAMVDGWRAGPAATSTEPLRQLDPSERREAGPRPAHRRTEGERGLPRLNIRNS